MKIESTTVTTITFDPGDSSWDFYNALGDLPSDCIVEPRPGKLRFIHPLDD